jgi:hypothetical protein
MIELVWSNGEIILAGKIRSGIKIRRIVTLSSINPAWTGLASNPSFGGESATTERLNLCYVLL